MKVTRAKVKDDEEEFIFVTREPKSPSATQVPWLDARTEGLVVGSSDDPGQATMYPWHAVSWTEVEV